MISLKHKHITLVSDFGPASVWHAVNDRMVRLTQYEDGSCDVDILTSGICTIFCSNGKGQQESMELKVTLHGLRYAHLDVESLDRFGVAKIEVTPSPAVKPQMHVGV